MKKTAINLTDGPILRSIITFAIPIVISNIFQQLYNTADIMIVGRFLGQDALAAVGATAAIFELIVGFALGVGNGMGVIIARYYGANKPHWLALLCAVCRQCPVLGADRLCTAYGALSPCSCL